MPTLGTTLPASVDNEKLEDVPQVLVAIAQPGQDMLGDRDRLAVDAGDEVVAPVRHDDYGEHVRVLAEEVVNDREHVRGRLVALHFDVEPEVLEGFLQAIDVHFAAISVLQRGSLREAMVVDDEDLLALGFMVALPTF